MKYTVNQAAKIVGATRQTVYRHIESKPISVEKDENGNQLIDASELIRVYGDKIDFNAIYEDDSDDVTTTKTHNVTKSDKDSVTSFEEKIQLIRLEAEISTLKEVMKRTEEENSYIKKLLEEEKSDRKKANNLLEDMRQKESKDDAWEKSIRALEQRLANQEKAAKEREEKEQKLLDENKRIRQAYSQQKKALEEEKSKSIWQKLFG